MLSSVRCVIRCAYLQELFLPFSQRISNPCFLLVSRLSFSPRLFLFADKVYSGLFFQFAPPNVTILIDFSRCLEPVCDISYVCIIVILSFASPALHLLSPLTSVVSLCKWPPFYFHASRTYSQASPARESMRILFASLYSFPLPSLPPHLHIYVYIHTDAHTHTYILCMRKNMMFIFLNMSYFP